MNIISQLLGKKIVPVAIVAFVTVLTLGTSVMGASKVAGSISKLDKVDGRTSVAEVSKQESIEKEHVTSDQETENTNNVGKIVSSGKSNSLPKTTSATVPSNVKAASNLAQATTATGTNTTTNTSSISNPNACVITVFGKQYDVTSLRSSHPGGDVFVCGTDQSGAYQSAHGTSVSRLAPYLVASQGVSGTTSTGATVGGGQGSNGGQAVSGASNTQQGVRMVISGQTSRREDDGEEEDTTEHRSDDNEREEGED